MVERERRICEKDVIVRNVSDFFSRPKVDVFVNDQREAQSREVAHNRSSTMKIRRNVFFNVEKRHMMGKTWNIRLEGERKRWNYVAYQ